jgi:hypothetical protein
MIYLINSNRAVIPPLLLTLLLLLALWLGYRRYVFIRRALALDWPPGLSNEQAFQYAKFYLRRAGWTFQESPYVAGLVVAESQFVPYGIRLSALKDQQRLNIYIPQRGSIPLSTQLRDMDEAADKIRQVVTVVTYGVPQSEVVAASATSRVLLIEPRQLGDAVNLLRAHRAAAATEYTAATKLP